MLLIKHDATLVPTDGMQVYSGTCTYAKSEGKDAAGSAFHRFALLQAGLLGAVPTPFAQPKHPVTDVAAVCFLAQAVGAIRGASTEF